jgi:cardiolipin synthase
VVSDDECAICGTINTDYRSFYLHYECGVFISEVEAIKDMKSDFLETLKKCREMELYSWSKRPLRHKVTQSALKILSPLL